MPSHADPQAPPSHGPFPAKAPPSHGPLPLVLHRMPLLCVLSLSLPPPSRTVAAGLGVVGVNSLSAALAFNETCTSLCLGGNLAATTQVRLAYTGSRLHLISPPPHLTSTSSHLHLTSHPSLPPTQGGPPPGLCSLLSSIDSALTVLDVSRCVAISTFLPPWPSMTFADPLTAFGVWTATICATTAARRSCAPLQPASQPVHAGASSSST